MQSILILSMAPKAVITSSTWQPTKLGFTPAVIVAVHALATHDRMPQGLKVSNQAGITLYDSSWIAGVDFEDSDYKSDYDSLSDGTDSDSDDDDPDDDEYNEDGTIITPKNEQQQDYEENQEENNDEYDIMEEIYEDLDININNDIPALRVQEWQPRQDPPDIDEESQEPDNANPIEVDVQDNQEPLDEVAQDNQNRTRTGSNKLKHIRKVAKVLTTKRNQVEEESSKYGITICSNIFSELRTQEIWRKRQEISNERNDTA